jgi:hypothetical protein
MDNMDNLSVHKGKAVRELLEERGDASCGSYRPTRPSSTPYRRSLLQGEGYLERA